MACKLPNTATRSLVFMATELSTLCTTPSSALKPPLVNLPYMGATGLRERLIEIADELGNDAEFARIAKVSRSAVSQWRAGDVKALKALSAVNIQERTGYSVRWLILGIGPKKLSGKQENGALPHNSVRSLSPSEDKKLLAVIKAFFDTDQEGRTEIVKAVEAISGTDGPDATGRRQDKGPGTSKQGRGGPSR
jgi:hypothetical protein